MFLFAGPTLTAEQEASVRLPPDELAEWRWCEMHEAQQLLADRVSRRLSACLTGKAPSAGSYLEEQTATTSND